MDVNSRHSALVSELAPLKWSVITLLYKSLCYRSCDHKGPARTSELLLVACLNLTDSENLYRVCAPPLISAPIDVRYVARSTISGSIAAFSITVFPLANVAAIIMFSVAPTLGKSRYTFPPVNRPFLTASMYPWPSVIDAPRAVKPFRWRSTGLVPMAQPPGREILTCPSWPALRYQKEVAFCLDSYVRLFVTTAADFSLLLFR